MAGEKPTYTPKSVKKELANAKYGEKQASKGVVVSKPGIRESTADLTIYAAEKWTVPWSLVGAFVAAPFVPIVSAGLLANAGQDYIFKEIAKEERSKLKKERMKKARESAARDGKVVLDNADLTAEIKKRKKIEMNLRAKQGTIFDKKQVALAA